MAIGNDDSMSSNPFIAGFTQQQKKKNGSQQGGAGQQQANKPSQGRFSTAVAQSGAGQAQADFPSLTLQQAEPYLGSRKKGGRIKQTGLYKLHRGEFVVPAVPRRSGRKTSRKRTVTKF